MEFRLNQIILVFLFATTEITTAKESAIHDLNEDNWRLMLVGEWMVEFYAPWCPACNNLQPVWREYSLAAKAEQGVSAGAVDVTTSPGLSGRFIVTALPTIYHVIDGQFRQYKGSRDVDSLLSWTRNKKWRSIEPVSSWKAPDSMQMSVVASFFKISQNLRGVHNMLMETYGLPTWGSYLIFAVGTIFVGALLGLLLVCAIDLFYPPNRGHIKPATPEEETSLERAKGDGQEPAKRRAAGDGEEVAELLNDDLLDDEEDGTKNDSDAEKNSQSDSQSSDTETSGVDKTSSQETVGKVEGAGEGADLAAEHLEGDGEPGASSTDVRKRRSRKAD